MKTKDILLVVGGIALGYLALKNFGKKNESEVENLDNTSYYPAPPIPLPIVTELAPVYSKKQLMCEDKWQNEIGSVSRLSKEALEKSKSDYVKNCVAS